MSFTTPLALSLLLLTPYFIWLGWPSRRTSQQRDWASLILRLMIAFLLILSLAGMQLVRAADDLAVVFLIDASDSIDPIEAEKALKIVRQTIEEMGPMDRAAVVVFGSNALVERPMSGLAQLAPITSIPETLHTDIAEAIRLGMALFPAGNARRMVLISDGTATVGAESEAARLAAKAGIQIDVMRLSRPVAGSEALLTQVDAPGRVSIGERFSIEILAESTANMAAQVTVLAAGSVVYEQAVTLRPGNNHFSIQLQATTQEFARYIIQLTPAEDTYLQNNQLAAYTEIVGPPRVLLVSQDGMEDETGRPFPEESLQLGLALEATGLVVDRVTPTGLPATLSRWSNYSAVVLVNVNAKNLTTRKMDVIQSYVRDLGGGLVVIGGPHSYGMGGYFRTPLEESLPVDMQIKDQERFPAVSIVLVIDRSGSMAAPEGGVTKIQLAAEGAVRVVELLNDFDEITIIPVDTRPDNPIGPASAANREAIIGQIRQIGAGGGGIFVRTGLEAAAASLAKSPNEIKHVVVLADGADSEQKEGVAELIESLASEGITFSMISIGEGADVPWLQQMAELGGGRFHFTDRASNLPQIFTQETTSIQRSYLVEERFFPNLSESAFARQQAIFQAMESAGITYVPPLFGYVATSPKETAQVILETPMGDPLLATWEYGLGRAVAWTSDATGRWGAEWVDWTGFPTFWSNVVRWTISQGLDNSLETLVSFQERTAWLEVDARTSSGDYLNDLTVEASIVSPTGEATHHQLRQVAPGRYGVEFTPTEEGAYLIGVSGSTNDEEVTVGQINGWVLTYSPEYRQLQADDEKMLQIAEQTGGRDLTDLSPVESAGIVLEHDLPITRAALPIWPWLIAASTLLLPIDIAVRRLVFTRQDVARAWSAITGRLLPETTPAGVREEQLARLLQAKERAGVGKEGYKSALDSPPTGEGDDAEDIPTGESLLSHSPSPEREAEPEPTSGKTLASRLLERRRRQIGSDD